jgi:hypothetical protein
MNSNIKKPTRTLGLILYLAGAVLGLVLLALLVWGDIEASTFGSAQSSDEKFKILNCPVFITKDEVGEISLVIDNPTDRDVTPLLRSTITFKFVTLVDEQEQRLSIPAGGSQTVTWQVTRENAAYGSVILARFYQLSNYSLPSREEFCGIVVLPFSGLTGQQAFIASFFLSLILVAVGIALYAPKGILRFDSQNLETKRLRTTIRAYIFLGAYFLVAVLLTLVVNPLIQILLMVFAVVSAVAVFSFAASAH